MNREMLEELWQTHKGRIVGMAVGLLFGLMVLILGVFKTLFLLVCAVGGYLIGKKIDQKEDLLEILDKILPPGYHR